MSLIAMRDVNFGFGGPPLLEGLDFQIGEGERVCLLGRNGCGKSTFLRLLKGELKPESGEIMRQPQLRIGMLNQSVPQQVTGKVFDVVAEGLGQAWELLVKYHRIAHEKPNESDENNAKLIRLHNELEKANSWKKLNVVETVISLLSIDADAEFSELSAGLKRRVLLAKALAAEPDILILDEPTNHLDIEAISWMEDFLLRCGKSLLFVTHDRKFLKKISTRIVEIDRGKIFNWECPYDEYLKRKEQLLAAEQIHWDQFEKKLAEEERWIRKGIRARRTRDEGRVRALQKMRQLQSQRRKLDGLVKMEINEAQRSGELVVKARGVSFTYDNSGDSKSPSVICDLNTIIFRGDRIGIVGPNGIGKTTLLRLLLGEIAPTKGDIKLGTNVQCAYFDQLHGQLAIEKSLIENIGQGYDMVTINGRKKHVIKYLMDFMFASDKVKLPASNLSGGERNRLQIAKVFTMPSNVLVLDEPTNDLDIETLELLEDMLLDYPGTVLVVSHDREFLNNVVTSTLVFEDGGKLREYAGGYDDMLNQRKNIEAETVKQEKAVAKEKRIKPKKAASPKLTYMQKRELEKLPDIIEKFEKQILSLHEKMAEPSFYKQDGVIIARETAELEKLESELAKAYSRWRNLRRLSSNPVLDMSRCGTYDFTDKVNNPLFGADTMAKTKKSWEKRLMSQPDELAVDFVQSLSYDRRLYKYDIAGSIAHAQMLAKQKLITKSELGKIKKGLLKIESEISNGKFKFDKTLEDIHMAIEAALIQKTGEAGKKLHTARSRNDQVALDIRMWMRDQIDVLRNKISALQKAFLHLAEKYTEDVMPSYTHMQQAQPIVIAAYLLNFVEQFERDYIRLGNCQALLNVSPLGSGAVAGSTLRIDRKSTASQLGFAGVSRNSIDAVSDRDFCAEFIFDCSLAAAHLSRLAEDWIIYASNEFSFIRIDDKFCTSSSMMPQKRNPDMLELIRGKTGTVYGALFAMLTILKAQPSGYNRDLQEDKIHVFSASDTVSASLDMACAIVANTKFNSNKISQSIDEGFLDATALAEYLVVKGVAFRQAHGIVGGLVAACEKQGKKLSELSLVEFKKHSAAIECDVYKHLGAANVVSKYVTDGSAGARQAKEQIMFWQKRLAQR